MFGSCGYKWSGLPPPCPALPILANPCKPCRSARCRCPPPPKVPPVNLPATYSPEGGRRGRSTKLPTAPTAQSVPPARGRCVAAGGRKKSDRTTESDRRGTAATHGRAPLAALQCAPPFFLRLSRVLQVGRPSRHYPLSR